MKLKRMISLGLSLVMALSALNTAFAGDDTGAISDKVQVDTDMVGDEAASEGAVATYAIEEYSYPVEGGNIYYNREGTITDCDESVTKAIIPDTINGVNITAIGDRAFVHCVNLTDVTIPGSVTAVGRSAFMECHALTAIAIPEGVTTIEAKAFYFCRSLSSVYLPDSLTYIGDWAFESDSLANIDIPAGVTHIGIGAFASGDMLSINVDEGNSTYKSVGGAVFSKDGSSLLHFPAGLEGEYNIPEGTTVIGEFAFNDTWLTAINIPASVREIGVGAFSYNFSLTDINVDAGNTAYKSVDGVLFTVDGSALVAFPSEKVEEDYNEAWEEDYNEAGELVYSYTVPLGVTRLEDYSFSFANLSDIILPEGLTYIGDSAFNSVGGMFVDVNINIPNEVTYIGEYAFDCINYLNDVSLPEGLTYIGDGAFQGCVTLTSVTIPDSVEYLGEYAYFGCENLTQVKLGKGLTTIADSTFLVCDNLTSVTIPSQVTAIEKSAFDGCNALADVYYAGSEEQWANMTIEDYNDPLDLATIHYNASLGEGSTVTNTESTTEVVTSDSTSETTTTTVTETDSETTTTTVTETDSETTTATVTETDSETTTATVTETDSETTTENIPDGVYPVEGGNIYYDMDGTITGADKGIVIDEIPYTLDGVKITAIGDNAFAGCENLTDIKILNNITSIGENAFGDCTNLTNISLTGATTTIADSAVSGSALATVIVVEGAYGETWANDKGYTVEHKTFLYGDANYDTILGAQDAVNILQKVLDNSFLTGMDKNGGNTSLYLDTNGDGVVGAQDAAITLQKVLDNSYRMPCELK